MAKTISPAVSQKRQPRLLWANPFCLMDTSSGASMTVRQMLAQLASRGYAVQILGATVFDNVKGMGRIKEQFPELKTHLHQLIEAKDDVLTHQLIVSYSHERNHFTTHEEGLWYSQYLYLLDSFKPDIIFFYGGQTLDMLIADEARDRGIPVASYLANGNYKSSRWCRDVDLILTDSQATADMYRKTAGYTAKPVGKFIAPDDCVADSHERKRLLFVNPSWQKGASIFVQLAERLERERPDIELEVVEARADWHAVLRETTKHMGQQRHSLSNVVVTPNTSDMRAPYSRARVVIAPSLWWESSGRVLAEAMLNGIPALITNRGGMPEMIDGAGIALDFPDSCHEAPYQYLLDNEELKPLYEAVLTLFDDEALYQAYAARAQEVGKNKHHLSSATERLLSALRPLARLRAGNKDFTANQKKRHRQRLASVAIRPTFDVDTSLQQLLKASHKDKVQTPRLWLSHDFTWQLKSKVIVLDNRAKLIKNGLADQMLSTGAFSIVAFDPASEVPDIKQYEGSEDIQVFQHALLGDGEPATLHACVSPALTGTLLPLPAEMLPKHRRLDAQLLSELPINTIALDSIEGLGNLDWLILDELSDAMAALKYGENTLKSTLVIQARVALQPTHANQASLAELQHWANHNGFRFYRLVEFGYHSHLPENLEARQTCASEQESADILFLPDHERMASLDEQSRLKLAFILSVVFEAHDIAYELLSGLDKTKAKNYLDSTGLVEPVNDMALSSSIEGLQQALVKKPLSLIEANHSLPGHLVVSLTSYRARFENLHFTLRSLLLQSTCPDVLVLWIAEEEKEFVPANVWKLEQYGLKIYFCEDIRSYKKIIPTLREYPDSFIVTADDDLYYETDWLQKLIKNWDGNSKTIVAHRAHKITLATNGLPLPYKRWKWEVNTDESVDGLIFPTTGAGTLYPPRVFHHDVYKASRFMEICPTTDDIWLYCMATLNGAKAKKSSYEMRLIEWPSKDNGSLWKENIQGGGNDGAMQKIMQHYGTCWKNQVSNSELSFYYGGKKVFFNLPNKKDHIQRIIRSTRSFYETGMLEDIKSRAKKAKVIFDVGANIGNHTIYFAKFTKAKKVFAFEPHPITYSVLKKNVTLNALGKKITCYNAGLSDCRGKAEVLFYDEGNIGMSRLAKLDSGEIELFRADEVALAQRIKVDLMKIDVEGMEIDVLNGSHRILHEDRPMLYVEAGKQEEFTRLTSYLSDFGYRPVMKFNATPTYLFLADS